MSKPQISGEAVLVDLADIEGRIIRPAARSAVWLRMGQRAAALGSRHHEAEDIIPVAAVCDRRWLWLRGWPVGF